MKFKFLNAVVVGLTIAFSFNANAGLIITAGELITFGDGNSSETAQSIDKVTFNVTTGTNVIFDILAWEAQLNDPVSFIDLNSDGEITVLSTYLILFDSNYNYLTSTSNSIGSLGLDGSISTIDSYFSYTFSQTGEYVLAIAENGVSIDEARVGVAYNRIFNPHLFLGDNLHQDHADWQLSMRFESGSVTNINVNTLGNSALNEVPEPSTFVIFALGLMGLKSRKKHQEQITLKE